MIWVLRVIVLDHAVFLAVIQTSLGHQPSLHPEVLPVVKDSLCVPVALPVVLIITPPAPLDLTLTTGTNCIFTFFCGCSKVQIKFFIRKLFTSLSTCVNSSP
jgi:hypothetical protein